MSPLAVSRLTAPGTHSVGGVAGVMLQSGKQVDRGEIVRVGQPEACCTVAIHTGYTYASPVIGDMQIGDIELGHITKILEPIWTTKTETASRLRGRIESVLDWATVNGFREGENPARWKGHLDKILPQPSKVARVKHHAALPHGEIPAFILELREREGIAARALEVLILTASRSNEVRGATWAEFDH